MRLFLGYVKPAASHVVAFGSMYALRWLSTCQHRREGQGDVLLDVLGRGHAGRVAAHVGRVLALVYAHVVDQHLSWELELAPVHDLESGGHAQVEHDRLCRESAGRRRGEGRTHHRLLRDETLSDADERVGPDGSRVEGPRRDVPDGPRDVAVRGVGPCLIAILRKRAAVEFVCGDGCGRHGRASLLVDSTLHRVSAEVRREEGTHGVGVEEGRGGAVHYGRGRRVEPCVRSVEGGELGGLRDGGYIDAVVVRDLPATGQQEQIDRAGDSRLEEIDLGCSTSNLDVGARVVTTGTRARAEQESVTAEGSRSDVRCTLSRLVRQRPVDVRRSRVERGEGERAGRVRLILERSHVARVVRAANLDQRGSSYAARRTRARCRRWWHRIQRARGCRWSRLQARSPVRVSRAISAAQGTNSNGGGSGERDGDLDVTSREAGAPSVASNA